MITSSKITLLERIESLKSGIIAGSFMLLTFAILTGLNHLILAQQFDPLCDLKVTVDFNLIIRSGMTFLSGFLFGVTYRYVIRSDQNTHLKSGAILAFGLVRGFAELDAGLNLHNYLEMLAVLCIESLVLFAVAGMVLDWFIQQSFIKPFDSN